MNTRPSPPPLRAPRLFALYRTADVNGQSGTGVAAWGVEWPDGRAVTWWAASKVGVHQVEWWSHLGEITRVHGHAGRTRLIPLGPVAAAEQFDTQPLWALHGLFAQSLRGWSLATDVQYLEHALELAGTLPALLRAHDALAVEVAQLRAARAALEAERDAMQEALDAIADHADTQGSR
jgi:hypothetical protein